MTGYWHKNIEANTRDQSVIGLGNMWPNGQWAAKLNLDVNGAC